MNPICHAFGALQRPQRRAMLLWMFKQGGVVVLKDVFREWLDVDKEVLLHHLKTLEYGMLITELKGRYTLSKECIQLIWMWVWVIAGEGNSNPIDEQRLSTQLAALDDIYNPDILKAVSDCIVFGHEPSRDNLATCLEAEGIYLSHTQLSARLSQLRRAGILTRRNYLALDALTDLRAYLAQFAEGGAYDGQNDLTTLSATA
jgi:hypothetical protein